MALRLRVDTPLACLEPGFDCLNGSTRSCTERWEAVTGTITVFQWSATTKFISIGWVTPPS